VSDTRLIGTGTIRNFQWTLEAGDDDEAYGTGLDVTGPDGYRCSGGMGGPKLWGDDLINTYSSRNEEGPVGIAVRASPSVTRMVVRVVDGGETDLFACGPGVIVTLVFSDLDVMTVDPGYSPFTVPDGGPDFKMPLGLGRRP